MKIFTLAVALVLPVLPCLAQDNPIVHKLVDHIQTSKKYTLAVANQMPAENYAFKPTPEQMSFAEQVNHIANANQAFGMSDGGAMKEFDPKKLDKDTVIANVTKGYDTAIAMIQKMTDAQLLEKRKTMDGEMTGFDLAYLVLDHSTHHRGQLVVYLRLKGIKPTEYQF